MRYLEVVTSQLLVPAFFVFAFVWALVGAAIGVGLITSRDTTLRFFSWVNSWVSARTRMKWAELPRDTGRAVFAYRAWFAAAFIAGGLFILVVMVGKFDVSRIAGPTQKILAWLLESTKWILVAGSLLAIAVGVLLAFFPDTMHALEGVANRWVSTRQMARPIGEGGDRMHLALDRAVSAYPRAAGWVLLVLSLGCIVATGWTLFAR
jgi:hypothetical protein